MQLSRPILLAGMCLSICSEAYSQLTLRAGVRLGESDASPALTEPIEMVADTGAIYVLQPLAATIHVFGRDGAFIRTIGRRGLGPGEFALPYAIHLPPASGLVIADQNTQRLSNFSLAGVLLETHPLPSTLAAYRMFQHRPLANGALLVLAHGLSQADQERDMLIISPDSAIRVVRRVSIATRTLVVSNPRNPRAGQMDVRSALASQPLFVVNPSGSRFVILDRSNPSKARVDVYDMTGRLLRTFDHFTRAMRFTGAARNAYRDTLGARAVRAGIFGSSADARSPIDALLPRYVPPITSAVLADDEILWLRGHDDQTQRVVRWYRRTLNGRSADHLDLPRTSTILFSTANTIFVLERDQLDVPYVQQYMLQ